MRLDFRFVYLDSGLSSAELYRQEQENGLDMYRRLLRQALAAYPGDLQELDRDGDGYVDLTVMLSGEDIHKTVGDGNGYYVFGGGSMATLREWPDPNGPGIGNFIHMSAKRLLDPLSPSGQSGGPRVLIHEIGHAFGLIDYYDFYPDENGEIIDALGLFDMQAYDMGDWNPFSRFLCGWVEPWLIEEETEQISLKISPDQPLLIPGSGGWNQTPFDEYILIDVAAPQGANGYDWDALTDERLASASDPKRLGGVRVYHVDGRVLCGDLQGARVLYSPAFTREAIEEALHTPHTRLDFANYNSNGVAPLLEGLSPYYHLIDWIPADGSSKFRLPHPLAWAIFTPAAVTDLFGPGEEFSMDACADAFPNAPLLNRGDSLAYRVRVESYDPETFTAIVTVTREN